MFNKVIASLEDIENIETLMDLSISKILGNLLDSYQIEAARESMGLDTQLIFDKTYFQLKKEKH